MIDLSPAVKQPRKKTSVSLPGDLLQEANKVARRHGISLSEYVKWVVEADLAERRRRPL